MGQSVLDLGCGTGTDCFVLSKLVGENGKVVGVDMAEEQVRTLIIYMNNTTARTWKHVMANLRT